MTQTGGLTQKGVRSGKHLLIHLDRERLKEKMETVSHGYMYKIA